MALGLNTKARRSRRTRRRGRRSPRRRRGGGQTFLSVTRDERAASNDGLLNASRSGEGLGRKRLRWRRHFCLPRGGERVGAFTRPEPTRTSEPLARRPGCPIRAVRTASGRRGTADHSTARGRQECLPHHEKAAPPDAFPAERFHVRDAFSRPSFEAARSSRVTDKNVCPPPRRWRGLRLPLLRVLRAFVLRPSANRRGESRRRPWRGPPCRET